MRINISFKKGLGRAKICAVLENGKKNFSESRITYRKISVGCVVAEKQSLCDVQDEIHSTLPLYDISARAENLGKKAPERQSLSDVQNNPNQSISSSNIPAEIEAISENPAEKQSLIGVAKKIVSLFQYGHMLKRNILGIGRCHSMLVELHNHNSHDQ